MAAAGEEAEVIKLNNDLVTCIGAKDWDTYKRLVDPALTCFESEAPGVLVEGLDFHKFYFDLPAAPKGKTRTTLLDLKANMLTSEVCLITYVRLMQCVGPNGPFTAKAEESRVWQKKVVGDSESPSWVMVHFHRSGAPSNPT